MKNTVGQLLFALDESIGLLRENFVFNSSLGSKELFHSNLLGMLLLQKDSCNPLLQNVAEALIKFFAPQKPEESPSKVFRVISVFREFHKFDLFIAYIDEKSYEQIKKLEHGKIILDSLRDSSDAISLNDCKECEEYQDWLSAIKILHDNCRFVIVENKFKSLPDNVQLSEYWGKVLRKTPYIHAGKKSVKCHLENTTFYLLTVNYPVKTLPDILSPRKQLSYAQIVQLLDKSIETFSNKADAFTVEYLKKYCDMLRFHLWLNIEITKSINKYAAVFPDKIFSDKLDQIRLKDFYEKVWFSKLDYCLGEFWSRKKDCDVIKEAGFTNGHGLMGFKCVMHDGSRIAYGVQMQNRQFRFYVEPLPPKYYRPVEFDEKLRQGHLPQYEKKTYHWKHFDEGVFFEVLDKVKRATIKKAGCDNIVVSTSKNLNKFDDFKYVYLTLPESTTQQQLRELSKIALVKLGEMVQKNRKLFEV